MSTAAIQSKSFYEEKKGLKSWIFSTDHKRIGLLYFYSLGSFFLVGVILGLLMRLELISPGETIMKAKTYRYKHVSAGNNLRTDSRAALFHHL